MLVLEVPCGVISVHVKLGEKREVIIMGVTILMSFDVLESWAKGKLLERMPNFVKNIPIRGKCSRWRLVAGGCRRGIERCPFFIEQVGSWKGGLVGKDFVNEGKIITRNDAVNCLHGVLAILKQAEKEAKKGQHTIPSARYEVGLIPKTGPEQVARRQLFGKLRLHPKEA
jgi:hypothetical protein